MWTESILGFVPAIPALIMAVEDMQRREIHVAWLTLFLISTLSVEIVISGISTTIQNTIYNALILCFVFFSLCIWLMIKEGSSSNLLTKYIGIGDILFFASIAPLFNMKGYVIFLIASFCLSIIYWVIMRVLSRDPNILSIPLVSMAFIIYLVYVAINM
jgi:hypothetical protein